jgi:drug/metabolite transporter (DMT)-like permease
MEPWIGLSLLGVLIQSARTVLQKNLTGRLSVGGATYSRFLYGSPLAWLMVAGIVVTTGHSLPHPGAAFFVYITLGGLAQILGNAIFIHLVRASNFTVITTYIKTETVISALFSFIVLNDILSFTGFTCSMGSGSARSMPWAQPPIAARSSASGPTIRPWPRSPLWPGSASYRP